jgi:hypothetical protein
VGRGPNPWVLHYGNLSGSGLGHNEVVSWYQHNVVPLLANATPFVAPQGIGTDGPLRTQRFTDQVYSDLLGRVADPPTLVTWNALLESGSSRSQLLTLLEGTAEYRAQVIEGLYATYLDRLADQPALNAGIQFLASGGSVTMLRAALIGSAEYYQTRAGGTGTGFVTALYQDVLHRLPDAGGTAAVETLLGRGVSRTAIAGLILGSAEAEQDLVDADYLMLLHRHADAAGLATFSQALEQGAPEESLITALAGSDEYFDRL